ncbi:DUF6250 domain-containing protein, partial [Verrucomicrobia bacterium]|nr:DUF6250 domain-containing protein [Verrucomicrobiota bacterium]
MTRKASSIILLTIFSLTLSSIAQNTPNPKPSDEAGSVVLGHGVGLFKVGPLLVCDEFKDLKNWEVQVQEVPGNEPVRIEARDGALDCLVPGRGCTVWFKRTFKTRVTISYDVLCPTPMPAIKGVQPRDINNFWMAADPIDPSEGLFDSVRYNGAFASYDKMHGYYASTGGGTAAAANLTTRMRRYPREVGGKPADHLALNDKDEQADYLITPDKVMSVQLVAYDDVIQYIVDGRLTYEIAQGDRIQIEGRDGENKRVMHDGSYDLKRFPVYREGYFGFRMVGTHHVYSNFRVHTLEPARREVAVSSITALSEAVQESDQTIVMNPGRYSLADLPEGSRKIPCSGSNNTIDLSDVYVSVPVGSTRRSYITISGDHNVFKGGTFEDTYLSGIRKVTDFSAYNQNRSTLAKGLRGSAVLTITGDNNRVVNTKLTIRGSFPYGYGSLYGIGRDNVYGLDKRCGILIKGESNTIDGCEIQQRAFGHGIYMQNPADKTHVKNTLVEGAMRPSKDLYLETNPKDLPARSNYKMPRRRNSPIPMDVMLPLSEDGIRVYTRGGSVIVENCTVKRMRGGIRVYLASRATVINSTAIDCGNTNFNLPSGGKITGSTGNFSYAPLSDFRLSKSRQDIELTILPSPHAVGSHHVADVLGNHHSIVFHRSDGPIDKDLRPIVVEGDHSTIRNETEYPIIPQSSASGNTVISFGPVTDLGDDNRISNLKWGQ